MSRIVKYILMGTMLMVICMTTACSVKNKNNTAGVHISILAKNSQYTDVDYESTEVIRKVSENSGYDIEWKLRQPDSYYDVVRELILNGDTLADIIQLPDMDMNMEYINTGKFVCLDEYLDYMPNYKKFLQSNPDIKASLTTDTGHIYYVPQTVLTYNYVPCVMYNQEWLKKAGKSEPQTLDELVELLRIYKSEDMNDNGYSTDEIPLSIIPDFIPYMFGPAFGLDLSTGFLVDDYGNVSYSYSDSVNYRKYLEFVNDLYEEGLIEKDYEKCTRDIIKERCSRNITGVTFDYSWHMSMLYSAQYNEYNGDTPVFKGGVPLSGEHQGFYIGRNAVSGIFGVTKTDNVISAVKVLDYLISDYNEDMYCFGIDGVSYCIDDEGNKVFMDAAKDDAFIQKLGVNPICVPSRQSVAATDMLLPEWHIRLDKQLAKYVRKPLPFMYVSSSDVDKNNGYINYISKYVDDEENDFITGRQSLSSFDAYLNTLDNMGIKEITSIKQKQYNLYKNNM